MSAPEVTREFEGKRAFVTGGSRGIGRAVCIDLAHRGADVAFIYRSRDAEAEDTLAQVRALGRHGLAFKVDLSVAAAVTAAVDRASTELSGIDVLVHAAGAVVNWRPVADIAVEEWDRYLAVDLSGAFYVLRASIPHLRRVGGGAIVAISSIAAQMCQARNAQGASAKAGLEALVRVIAREEGKHGIRANVVAIGLTDTDMGRAAFEAWGPEATQRVIRGIPLQRIGTPEEVARVVCFLVGAGGSYITGKVLQVDGGQIIAA